MAHRPLMIRLPLIGILVLSAVVLIPGCLTEESKELRVRLSDDGSGEATLLFINIQSVAEDTTDATREDFVELITSYVKGATFEEGNPQMHVAGKRLFEKDGMLNGEVTFRFDSLEAIRLFRYESAGPYMLFLGSPVTDEELVETNGRYGGKLMPVIFWPPATRELYIKTRSQSPGGTRHSILDLYRSWKRTGILPGNAEN